MLPKDMQCTPRGYTETCYPKMDNMDAAMSSGSGQCIWEKSHIPSSIQGTPSGYTGTCYPIQDKVNHAAPSSGSMRNTWGPSCVSLSGANTPMASPSMQSLHMDPPSHRGTGWAMPMQPTQRATRPPMPKKCCSNKNDADTNVTPSDSGTVCELCTAYNTSSKIHGMLHAACDVCKETYGEPYMAHSISNQLLEHGKLFAAHSSNDHSQMQSEPMAHNSCDITQHTPSGYTDTQCTSSRYTDTRHSSSGHAYPQHVPCEPVEQCCPKWDDITQHTSTGYVDALRTLHEATKTCCPHKGDVAWCASGRHTEAPPKTG